MAVVGEIMEDFVLEQIDTRQKFAGKLDRDNKHHKFTTSRTAWIKLASGVSLKKEVDGKKGSNYGGGLKFPKKYVLFNGASKSTEDGGRLRKGIGFEKSYDTSDKDFGIVPMPGIINASVKALNRGSIKKATIKIKANSRRQFEIIDELYLRLGYTMMLEWGWSHYLTDENNYELMGPTIIDKNWFFDDEAPGPSQFWLQEIIQQRRLHSGNYDAMFGRVVNFTWDFNEDGTYDIELYLISYGDVIESLRTLPTSTTTRISEGDHNNCFENFWVNVAKKSLLFSKTKPIYESSKWEWINNYKGPAEFQLDTSAIQDKLTEYLYSVAFFNFCLFSHSQSVTVAGNPTYQKFPFKITEYKPHGGPGVTYNGKDSLDYLYSGYSKEFTNRRLTTTGMTGFFSYSEDPLTKTTQKIVESIIAFDGGLKLDTTESGDDAFPQEEFANIEGFAEMNSIYDPLQDPLQRSYIRLGNLLKALELFCVPVEKGYVEPVVNIETDKVIPMYIPPQSDGFKQKIFSIHQSQKPETVIASKNDLSYQFLFNTGDVVDNASYLFAFKGEIENVYENINGTPEPYHCFMRAENLYISIPYIMGILPISKNDSNETRINLFNFLKDICQEINQAFGSMNNLEPVLNEDTNTLRLQDSTNFPYRKELYKQLGLGEGDDLFASIPEDDSGYQPIQVYGYRSIGGTPVASFVRKINLQTKISKELATIAAIGATAGGTSPSIEATALSRFNVGKINRFASEYGYNTEEDTSPPKTIPEQLRIRLFTDPIRGIDGVKDCSMMLGYEAGSMNTNNVISNPQPNNKGVEMSSDIQKNNMNFFKRYLQYSSGIIYKDTEAGSPHIGFLPFEFSLDMDGLSGVKIYNKINVDTTFLPSNYPRSLEFVLKGVEHSISDNDWVTKLVSIAVPRTSDIKTPISSDINIDAEDSTPPDGSGPNPNPDKCDCGCEGPGGAQNMIGTWNNSKKKKLINYSGTEIWPIMGWDNKKVFWEGGKPYALPKPGRKAKRNKYKKNPQFTELLTSWSHQGRNFKMLNIKSPVTGLTLQQSINKTLDSLKSQGLLNSTFAFIDGTNTKLCNNRGRLSGHAFAIALDINSDAYPWGSSGTKKWKKFLKWWVDGDAAAGASLTYEEKMKGKVIYVFSRINHNGGKIWTQGIGFGDPHHFTLNGWIM
jgi:hypothetical protein